MTPLPVTASRSRGAPLAGLLALAGGGVAAASAWLPYETFGGATRTLMDNLTGTSNIGYIVVAGGLLAAVCGLLLWMTAAPPTRLLLGIGAIAGGAVALAAQAMAYNDASSDANVINSALGSGAAVGYGVYAGIAAGAVAIVGGLVALLRKP